MNCPRCKSYDIMPWNVAVEPELEPVACFPDAPGPETLTYTVERKSRCVSCGTIY